jgi:hypothetical protein
MATRKEIPLLVTEVKNLMGTCEIDGVSYNVSGEIQLKVGRPFFKGTSNFIHVVDINHEPFDITFQDTIGRKVVCNQFNISSIHSYSQFESYSIAKVTITKGNLDDLDDVEVYNVIRSNKFSGHDFDQYHNRSINNLDVIKTGTQLCSAEISQIDSSSGYLFSPMKFNECLDYRNNILNKFYSILSFVFANFVSLPYQIIWKDSDNYIIEWSDSNYSTDGSGIFYTQYPRVIQNYFDCVWKEWDKYTTILELPALIEYYILIENQKHVESKMLLSCVMMEAFKHSFALKIAKYSQNKSGYFLKPHSAKSKYSFKELVKEVYSHFNVTDGDLNFIPYRNEVIHQGKISVPFKQQYGLFLDLITTIDKLLLNILNYKGLIWDRINSEWIDYK